MSFIHEIKLGEEEISWACLEAIGSVIDIIYTVETQSSRFEDLCFFVEICKDDTATKQMIKEEKIKIKKHTN